MFPFFAIKTGAEHNSEYETTPVLHELMIQQWQYRNKPTGNDFSVKENASLRQSKQHNGNALEGHFCLAFMRQEEVLWWYFKSFRIILMCYAI